MLDPEQLRNFLHVLDVGTLSAASRRAHVTQPALSRQMKLLEEEVGVQLFDRTGRGMRPTLEGRRLELKARPLLAELDNLAREFNNAPISGPLTLAVSPSLGMTWTAQVVKAFRKEYPLIDLRVVVTLSGSMGEAIWRGKFDLGLLHSPAASGGLMTADLWDEEAYFLCLRSHPHAKASSITCQNVLKSPLILPSSQHGVRALLEKQASRLGQSVNLEMEIDSVQLGMELVSQGVGNMVLTGRATSDIGARKLVAVPIRRPRLVRSAQLAAVETSLSRATVRAFWEFLVERTEDAPQC